MKFFSSLSSPPVKKFYLTVLFSILFLTGTYLAGNYYADKTDRDWSSIVNRKTEEIRDQCETTFNDYLNNTLEFSSNILAGKKLVSAFSNQNVKKSYEYLLELEQIRNFAVEVYNPRLDLFTFYGKHLNPDITELKRALSGEVFSSVKEVGFYTFLLVFRPIKAPPDSAAVKNESRIGYSGVLVTGKLMSIGSALRNKFFDAESDDIASKIKNKTGSIISFNFKNTVMPSDSSLINDSNAFELRGLNGEIMGRAYIPNLDKFSYVGEGLDKFSLLLSAELFVLSILLLGVIFSLLNKDRPGALFEKFRFLKAGLIGILLVAVRYCWLSIEFPQKLFTYFNAEVFSPSYYASSSGFGIAKSIGELLVSSVVVLIFCFYLVSDIWKNKRDSSNAGKAASSSVQTAYHIFIAAANAAIVLAAMQSYGYIMQSLVYDSNVKYFDKSQVISTGHYEILFIQLATLLISISFIIILLISGLRLVENLLKLSLFKNRKKPALRFTRKNIVLTAFVFLIIINFLIDYLAGSFNFSLKLSIRNLILILTGLFVFYFHRSGEINPNTKKYKFATLLNISLTVLICVIIIPVVLLNKIVSQENKYIELLARKSSEEFNDKAAFMLSSSLEDLSENTSLEADIFNKNKYPKLAFAIWSGSKLSSENFNSAVFVLDTSKKIISDFNTNPSELDADSVVSFTLRNFSQQRKDAESTAEDEENIETTEDVLQNDEYKYYSGIRFLEKTDLKNSRYSRILGYIIIAVQYDSRNYPAGTMFTDFTRDNLENKLISQPIFSEFTNGELVSSSDREISKSFAKSIDALRESLTSKPNKSAWRYDEFENNIYKSFYVLTSRNTPTGNLEKIFVVASRMNDFGTMTFFVFKELLFVTALYFLFLIFYSMYKAYRFLKLPKEDRPFIFGYREKLFTAFFIVSVSPIIILAVYTRSFVEEKNTEFYNEQLLSDLKLVNQYIKNKIPPADKADGGPREQFEKTFPAEFSDSHKNFNLFLKTRLIASTNEELYKSGLLDNRISARAYYNVALLKKDYFTENEEIGTFRFITGYKPVYDKFNNLLGIISSQTFFKQNEINAELTSSLVYVLGTYFVAVIFLVFIVNILSYRISNPIIKLLRATEQLSKGNVEVYVKSKSRDEIGELVKSFNKMIKELKRSREELKIAERESAWRDIARQVAHEIKNPLTPIKLAVQHLAQSYINPGKNAKDFKDIIQTTHNLIIDQIESLNRIATEFSNFAKMPSRNYEALKIDELIRDVMKLFRIEAGKNSVDLKYDGTESETNTKSRYEILGDRDEVKRALINIIRNSLQSAEVKTEKNYKGQIAVSSYVSDGYYYVRVKDNGVGMEPATLKNLFKPYFSTKSRGMGLGLMITKKIVDDMQGKIRVKSEQGKGTEVELKFKILQR